MSDITPPDNIDKGTVTGRFIYDVTDSPDPDVDPNFKAITGTVTFVASVYKVIDSGALPDPVIIGRVPIVCVLDTEGYLCTSYDGVTPAYRGVQLIATDDADLNPVNWNWDVNYNLKDQNGKTLRGFDPHPIAVLAGTTRDLSTAIPADDAQAVSVAQSEALAAQALAAADRSEAAAEGAEAALIDSAAFVGGQIATPGTPAEAAVAAKIASGVEAGTQDLLPVVDARARELTSTQLSKVFRPWHIALAQLATRHANVLFVTDSIGEGNGATKMANRFVWKFRDAVRARVQPAGIVGGAGYIPAYLATAGSSVTDFPVVAAGPANIGSGKTGLGLRYRNLSQAAHSLTLPFTGTGVDVLWTGWNSAGSFSWAIDGGSATTVNAATGQPAPPGKGGNATQIRGLSAGAHTLVVQWVSGNAYIEGFMVYNGDTSTGLRVWEGGHGGFATANFIGANAAWMDSIPATTDLVVIELGANDYCVPGGQVTPAVFKANMKTLIAGIRAKVTTTPTIVLVAVWDNGNPVGALGTWSEFHDAMWGVANEDAAGLTTVFDAWGRFQSHATGQAPVSLVVDFIHPTDAGHAYIGNSVTNFVLADFA